MRKASETAKHAKGAKGGRRRIRHRRAQHPGTPEPDTAGNPVAGGSRLPLSGGHETHEGHEGEDGDEHPFLSCLSCGSWLTSPAWAWPGKRWGQSLETRRNGRPELTESRRQDARLCGRFRFTPQVCTSWRRGRWDGDVPLLRKARFPAGTRRSPVVQTEANPGASAPGGRRCPGATGSRVRLVRRLCASPPCGRGNDSIFWSLNALCAKAPRRRGCCLAKATVFARPAPSALAEAPRTLPPEGGTQADCRQPQTRSRSRESRLAKPAVKTEQRRDTTTKGIGWIRPRVPPVPVPPRGSTHSPEDPRFRRLAARCELDPSSGRCLTRNQSPHPASAQAAWEPAAVPAMPPASGIARCTAPAEAGRAAPTQFQHRRWTDPGAGQAPTHRHWPHHGERLGRSACAMPALTPVSSGDRRGPKRSMAEEGASHHGMREGRQGGGGGGGERTVRRARQQRTCGSMSVPVAHVRLRNVRRPGIVLGAVLPRIPCRSGSCPVRRACWRRLLFLLGMRKGKANR